MVSMEYVITSANKYAALKGSKVEWVSFPFASVFKVKDRAVVIARRNGGNVEPFYGKEVASTKACVVPKQPQINRKSVYRSI